MCQWSLAGQRVKERERVPPEQIRPKHTLVPEPKIRPVPLQEAKAGEPIEFAVARRGTATFEDACRLFLIMAVRHGRVKTDKDPEQMDFSDVVAEMLGLSLISPRWCLIADTPLRRDVLAYMAARYLGCRPGLFTSLFGMTRRYAHREMVYREIIAPGPPGTYVSGPELLSVISRIERRVQRHGDIKLTDDEIH